MNVYIDILCVLLPPRRQRSLRERGRIFMLPMVRAKRFKKYFIKQMSFPFCHISVRNCKAFALTLLCPFIVKKEQRPLYELDCHENKYNKYKERKIIIGL